ncbi:DUF4349 domain-containing protein [Lysobacter brunescens]|uniref:DUF4349 domain-containing protein n=1 Tax=Lysobacter brunescens TaxID=262323 RepID=A0ABW2YBY0_9GAMM
MRRFVVSGFVVAMLLAGCSSADHYASEEMPAADASGNSASALKPMGTDHALSEFSTRAPAADASYSPPRAKPAQAANDGEASMLAYEHDVQVRLDADRIEPTLDAVRAACESKRFGACQILSAERSGGRYPQGALRMRAEPRAIEPLISSGGKGGEIVARNTIAEDLAVAVRDNTLLRDRLRKQHARLLEFQDRKDLKVDDVIALSEQLSRVEAELEAAERDAASHRRRLETQLLTIQFSPHATQEGRSEVAEALADTGRMMAASTAVVVRVIAALIPVVIALVIGIWLLRRMWRWVRRRRRVEE